MNFPSSNTTLEKANPGLANPLPGHPEMPMSDRYRVKVDGQEVEVRAERFDFDVAMFSLDGEAMVSVCIQESFSEYSIKPSRDGMSVRQDRDVLTFHLKEPRNLVLQIPNRTPLAIIVTPPEQDIPNADDDSVIYFEPGVHEAGIIEPLSGQTIYFAPGALVKGRIQACHVHGVRVCGRGFLETEGYSTRENRQCGVEFDHCRDVLIEGIALRSYHTWWQILFLNTVRARVENVNLFGVGMNTDGVDIDGVKDFIVKDSFIRAEDDGLGWHAVNAEANGEMITERVLAENLVIWNTRWGNGVRIGASMEAQLWRDITIRDLDILEHGNAGLYSDYCDWARIEDLRFEGITIGKPENPLAFKIEKNHYSNNTGFLDQRGHFDRLLFQNVVAAGGKFRLLGFDEYHRIHAVRFNGCQCGGEPLESPDQLDLNAFVTDLAFNRPLPARPQPIEGLSEFDELESRTNQRAQFIAESPLAANGRIRVFVPLAVGDYIEHDVALNRAASGAIKLRIVKGPSAGQASLSIGGKRIGDVIDFYADKETPEVIALENVDLPSGLFPVRFTIEGCNSASTGFNISLDAIEL